MKTLPSWRKTRKTGCGYDGECNEFCELLAYFRKRDAEKQLEEKMERWVYLNDLAERIAAQ